MKTWQQNRSTPTRALEAAVGRAATGQFYEIVPEHLVLGLLENRRVKVDWRYVKFAHASEMAFVRLEHLDA